MAVNADLIIQLVVEFLEVWDSPDSPEAMVNIVERLREAVES
jgi:hypothetical protein